MLSPNTPPVRRGFRWVLRPGCQFQNCQQAENCMGQTWPHWIEIKTDKVPFNASFDR